MLGWRQPPAAIQGSSLFGVGGFGGPAPQTPRHFALWGLPADGQNEASQLGWAKLARLPYRPLSRRSSCVPAELCPPLRCL